MSGSWTYMPERIRIYYEGNDDRALLNALQKGSLLPEALEIADRSSRSPHAHGRDGMIREIAALVDPNQVGGRAIALLDLDDTDAPGLLHWVKTALSEHLGNAAINEASPPGAVLSVAAGNRIGYVALVDAGLPEDEALRSRFGLELHAIDDYILRLACDQQVYAEVSEFRTTPHTLAMKKLDEMKALFAANGIPINRAKRLLHLLCATTGVRTSQATIIERVVTSMLKVKTSEEARNLLSPLLDRILEAFQRLASSP